MARAAHHRIEQAYGRRAAIPQQDGIRPDPRHRPDDGTAHAIRAPVRQGRNLRFQLLRRLWPVHAGGAAQQKRAPSARPRQERPAVQGQLLRIPTRRGRDQTRRRSQIQSVEIRGEAGGQRQQRPYQTHRHAQPAQRLFGADEQHPRQIFRYGKSRILDGVPAADRQHRHAEPQHVPVQPYEFRHLLCAGLGQ